MPLYEARSLDALGNPVDGYEVNDTRNLGEVYINPLAAESMLNEGNIPYTLVDAGLLGGAVEVDARSSDDVTFVVLEEAFARSWPDGGTSFIEVMSQDGRARERMRQKLERELKMNGEGAELEVVDGYRPVLSLEPQFISDNIAEEEFWSSDPERHLASLTHPNGWRTYIELAFDEESQRIQARVLVDDGNTSDAFEWQFVDWRKKPSLGWDPVSSEEIVPTKSQMEQILVAMDAFLESGAVQPRGDAECTVCGWKYESGHAGDKKIPICEHCAARRRR